MTTPERMEATRESRDAMGYLSAALAERTAAPEAQHAAPAAIAPLPAAGANLAVTLISANRHRAKSCFIGPSGSVSYRRLDMEVRRAASALTLLGVKPDDRVVLALDDSLELAVTFYACFAVGALPVVLNPNLDIEPLRRVLRDCTPVLMFATRARADSLAVHVLPGQIQLAFVDAGSGLSDAEWQPVGADPAWDAYVQRAPDQPACIQYTSGTTGDAKGVVHSAAGILDACERFARRQLGLTADDVLYSVPKAFFGYGMGNTLFFPPYLGASALLDTRWPTADGVVDNLRRYRPTVLFAVPTLYRMLLDSPLRARECALRLAFSAGAPLPENVARAWQAHFRRPLHDGIGATELCHVFATTYPHAINGGSVGRMVAGWDGVIVGADGEPVVPGEVGVLLVRSSARALGYWNRPAETGKKFDDPKLGRGWYRTGDLFSSDAAGNLYFHGREDDRFKVYGRWVVPVEIENLLAKHAPELGEVYLVGACDADGEQRPVLFLRPGQDGFQATADRIALVLAAHLEGYKRPALYLPLEDVPLTPNGKPNRRALGARACQTFAGRVAAQEG